MEYDKSLLTGKWREPTKEYEDEDGNMQQGYDYQVYNADGTGYTWDTSDNVTEDEAQKFRWTLVNDDLTHIHVMEMTGEESIPKVYTVTNLTDSELSYEDDYGKKHTFEKVK